MKHSNFSRREFLKIAALTSAAGLNATLGHSLPVLSDHGQNSPNVLIVLLDTLSARHCSLYGYPRETTPNLDKFANRSTVYHKHYSTGNFTAPATASLLTGLYPWSHGCYQLYGSLRKQYINKNFFSALLPEYTTYAYTQNIVAEILLNQMEHWILQHPSWDETTLMDERWFTFENDLKLSFWGEKIIRGEILDIKSAPYLSTLIDLFQHRKHMNLNTAYAEEFPNGVSVNGQGLAFNLNDVFQWMHDTIIQLSSPFIAYYHLFPPHNPFLPSKDFDTLFEDDFTPPEKPLHTFSNRMDHIYSNEEFQYLRKRYDQYIAYTDHELGLFLDELEASGAFENTTIILLSDHGESFERGILQHITPIMYDPLLHVPLVIHKPGQTTREDITTPTSHIDLLPTICQITGTPIPNWAEGEILAGFTETSAAPKRVIFSLEAKENSSFGPLKTATAVIIEWPYKLIYYFGYDELPEGYELYNLEEDPEEMQDLFLSLPDTANRMKEMLCDKLDEANQPYVE